MDTASRFKLLCGAALLLAAMCMAGLILLRDMRGKERYGERVRQIHGEARAVVVRTDAETFGEVLSRAVSGAGRAILTSGLVPAATRGQLEEMLSGAGVRGDHAVGVFFGAKMLALIFLPLLTWLLLRDSSWSDLLKIFVPAATGVLGLVLPDMIVKQMRKRFMGRLEKGLPDALDMMVICAQAG